MGKKEDTYDHCMEKRGKGGIRNENFYPDVVHDGDEGVEKYTGQGRENNKCHEIHFSTAQFHPELALWCQ